MARRRRIVGGAGGTGEAVRVIPLGGLGEVGMNMMVIESGRDLLVIDAGLQFPGPGTPGVERVVPNMDYVASNRERVRGVLITHGHLDHIGAVPHLLELVDVPVYASGLSADLVSSVLQKNGGRKARLQVVDPGRSYGFGSMSAEWYPMCHSIPDSCAIYVTTRQGGIFHTGDFKLDDEPRIGGATDYGALSSVAERGVRLLLSDSTNAMVPGRSGSDRLASDSIHGAMASAAGRVIVASFSTQLARMQMVADSAHSLGRKLAILGRGMRDTCELGRRAGFLSFPPGLVIPARDIDGYADHEVAIMTTGTQGESEAGLVRMSRGEHRDVTLVPEDTVIMSSRTIPGNEQSVNDVVNDLAKVGVKLITARDRSVHVSGHAARDELKTMLNLVQPEYFTPIHGEYRMLRSHCELALEMGIPVENVNLVTDGDVLEMDADGVRISGSVSSGNVLIHGEGEWDELGSVVRERRRLARDGVVFVSFALDDGGIVSTPRLRTSGFVDSADVGILMDDASQELVKSVDLVIGESVALSETEKTARACLERFLYMRTRRRPLIMVTQIDLRDGQTFD